MSDVFGRSSDPVYAETPSVSPGLVALNSNLVSTCIYLKINHNCEMGIVAVCGVSCTDIPLLT